MFCSFEVEIRFSIPKIIVEPPLMSIANALNLVARSVVQLPQGQSLFS